MGLNCAFAGVRNLAWKLAYVVRGLAPASLLETYESWLDEERRRSILDLFGTGYVVVLAEGADATAWSEAVGALQRGGFPARIERLEGAQLRGTPYEGEEAVVVRPDLVVAAHVAAGEAAIPSALLGAILPLDTGA